jgi:hypothetical protein
MAVSIGIVDIRTREKVILATQVGLVPIFCFLRVLDATIKFGSNSILHLSDIKESMSCLGFTLLVMIAV